MTQETLNYILKETMKYTGCFDTQKVLYSYDRMTVEELAQEVALKVLRAPEEDLKRTYIRTAVMFVCIDRYRKISEYDSSQEEEQLEDTSDDPKVMVDRLKMLDMFTEQELEVMLMLIEGHSNSKIFEILDIPHRTYYNILNRLREKHTELKNLRS